MIECLKERIVIMKIFKKYANTIIDLAKDTVSLSNGKELKSRGYINSRQFYKDCTVFCKSIIFTGLFNSSKSRLHQLLHQFIQRL